MINSLRQLMVRILRPRRVTPCLVAPTSRQFGYDRGTPIDRYYISEFISNYSKLVSGDVLEVGDSKYADSFAQNGSKIGIIGHPSIASSNLIQPVNLETGQGVSPDSCDCLIATQVMPFIYDCHASVSHMFRLLRPGGSVLATVGGISQISRYDMERWGDYWRFTDRSAFRLFSEVFGSEQVEIKTFGNVATAQALLEGLCVEEIAPALMTYHDPDYQVTIGICARKLE